MHAKNCTCLGCDGYRHWRESLAEQSAAAARERFRVLSQTARKRGPCCPICERPDDMVRNKWGQTQYGDVAESLICENPPCIFARTLAKSQAVPIHIEPEMPEMPVKRYDLSGRRVDAQEPTLELAGRWNTARR